MERQASDDLLNSQLWDKIFQELESGLWDVVVMSPPCNTFSRVRFNWKISPGPRPLRNFNWPRGFPWLTGFWKDKVESADSIYIHLAWLNLLQVGWSIENPGRSYLWNIEDYKILVSVAVFILFTHASMEATKKKLTTLLTNRV